MKKKILIPFSMVLCTLVADLAVSQNYIIRFDGIDDYVNLGSEASNGVRSIEMWFKPALNIDESLDDVMTLLARETSLDNVHEFDLSFVPENWANSGRLRFNFSFAIGNTVTIFSDTTFWRANTWYHVAVTLDFYEGMMMFIDGKKQTSYYPLYEAIPFSNHITTLGCWGNAYIRYFLGRVDDVRLSYNAIYLSDFEPPCPDIALADSTSALYHFNEGSGYVAFDSGPNEYEADIFGCVHIIDYPCPNLEVPEVSHRNLGLRFSPNPFNDFTTLSFDNHVTDNYKVIIYDIYGRVVRSEEIKDVSGYIIHRGKLSRGIYCLEIRDENNISGKGVFIVQ